MKMWKGFNKIGKKTYQMTDVPVLIEVWPSFQREKDVNNLMLFKLTQRIATMAHLRTEQVTL